MATQATGWQRGPRQVKYNYDDDYYYDSDYGNDNDNGDGDDNDA
jgi:hypothetical protein